jgi:hypothetical protein
MEKVVAQIEVEVPFLIDENSESASAWKTIKVHPGIYNVVRRVRYGATSYSVLFEGIVTRAGYGNQVYRDQIGTEGEVSRQLHEYELDRPDYWGNALVRL